MDPETDDRPAAAGGTEKPVLEITRIFDAPRELVWKAWTDPAMAVVWGGPREWPMISCEGEVRPGAAWRATLRQADGDELLHQGGVYREVAPPGRLVYTFAWQPNARTQESAETLVTIEFEEVEEGKTKMRFRQEGFTSVESRNGHDHGWGSAFDQLDAFLAQVCSLERILK